LCDTHRFPTTKMVARTRLIITFYVHRVSCLIMSTTEWTLRKKFCSILGIPCHLVLIHKTVLNLFCTLQYAPLNENSFNFISVSSAYLCVVPNNGPILLSVKTIQPTLNGPVGGRSRHCLFVGFTVLLIMVTWTCRFCSQTWISPELRLCNQNEHCRHAPSADMVKHFNYHNSFHSTEYVGLILYLCTGMTPTRGNFLWCSHNNWYIWTFTYFELQWFVEYRLYLN